ncbi:hypothetical protein WA026_019873 [Henosepilachna vigintioctopunctata]|uniref:Uncharacterized protein n=1 Tax=Henosepilachna vigintioctopunctata TaxID=420089 RepID=A0AAW1VFB0_9CUCU
MTSKYIFVMLALVVLVLTTTSAASLNQGETAQAVKHFFKNGPKGIKAEGQGKVACGRRGTTAATTTAATTTTTAAAGR